MATKDVKFVLSADDKASRVMQTVRGSLASVQGQAEKLSSSLGLIAPSLGVVAIVAAMAAFVRTTVNGLDALNDLKDATGATIPNLSALEDVAARTGTSFDTVGTSLIKFNKALTDAKPDSDIARILSALGLSAKALKEEDPAEALRKVAVALSNYADDGTKARLVQELFGKSIREVAPFLNDLANKTQLVGKVTAEQADEAEKFNHQLDELSKNSTDSARALVGNLLPALNGAFKAFREARAELSAAVDANRKGGGFWASIAGEFKANIVADELRTVISEIERLDAYMKKNPGNPKLAIAMDGLRSRAAKLTADSLAATDALKGFADIAKRSPTADDGSVNLFDGQKPRIKDPGSATPATAAKVSEFEKYIQRLKDAQLATLDLSAVEQAQFDISAGKLGKLNDAQQQYVLLVARGLDLAKQPPPFVGPLIDADELKRRNDEERKYQSLIAETPIAKFAELKAVQDSVVQAFDDGRLSATQLAEALGVLGKKYEDVVPKAKEAADEASEFGKQATRNIQDALGSSVKSILKSDFDSISQLWKNLLADLAAQAISANLGELFLGKKGILGGGSSGGLDLGFLSEIGKLFGGSSASVPSFAVGTDYVPHDMLAMIHQGERITPAAQNRGGGSDPVQIINNGPPVTARTETSTAPDGTRLKRIILDALTEDVARGGQASQAMQSTFGLSRQAPRRN